MNIGKLAKAAEVPTTTVRYYERVGLLAPPERSASRYRVYDDDTVTRVRFIKAAQAVGFTLDDIRRLLSFDAKSRCKDVQDVLTSRIRIVDQKLADLRDLRATLDRALDRCRRSRRGCPVLADFECCAPTESVRKTRESRHFLT